MQIPRGIGRRGKKGIPAECEEATASGQLAALRRVAEAAVAAEREALCPAEISAAQCIEE
jgi:hypothetical protein